MKKLILMLCLVVLGMTLSAQRGRVITMDLDSVNGNENVNAATITTTGDYQSLFISCKVDRVSTAAGGTLYLKTGLTAASALVVNSSTNPRIAFSPNDTLATADVATQYWNIEIPFPGAKNYYIFVDGDVNDTITVTPSYFLK